MSILNALISGHGQSALVCVDTISLGRGGERVECSKLIPLVYMPAVIGGRGSVGFIHCVAMTAGTSPLADFDALLEQMPAYLASGFHTLTQAHKQGLMGPTPDLQTIIAVGYSPRHQKIIGCEWSQKKATDGFVADPIEPYFIAPWQPSIDPLCFARTPADLEKLARAQLALMRDPAINDRPELATGGGLIVVRLERDRLTVHRQCNLDREAGDVRGVPFSHSFGGVDLRRGVSA